MSDGPDYGALARQLAQAPAEGRARWLQQHDAPADVELARALKALYTDAISGDPPLAASAAAALGALAQQLPDAEAQALADWTSGMAALQIEGQAEAAITLVDRATERFATIGLHHDAAATQASKLYALALLGRYDEAVACGEQARERLLAYGDTLAAGKIEQNLGNIYHRRDRYPEAERHYRAAHALFLAADDQRMLAFAENGLANVLSLQHQVREAKQLYERALERAVAVGAQVTQAEIACNLGCLELAQGRYDAALDYLEQSRRSYASLDMPHQTLLAELELADAYLDLNMAAEAAARYDQIVPALAALEMRAEQARALGNSARARVALGKLHEGEALAADAQRLYDAEGNAAGSALALLTEAQIRCAAGEGAAARKLAARAEAALVDVGAWGYLLLARWVGGEALRLMGDDDAAALLEATARDAQEHGLPQIERRCLASLGLLAARNGQASRAESLFGQAIALTERMRAPLPAEEFRTAYIADKLMPYTELVRLCLAGAEPGYEPRALALIERVRSRALLDTLRGNLSADAPPGDAAEAALLSTIETTREELNWFYTQLNRLPDSENALDVAAVAGLEQAVREREALVEQTTLLLRLRHGSGPLDAAELDMQQLQALLGPDTALVEYFCLDDEVLAVIVTDERVHVSRRLASLRDVEGALEQLRFQLGALRFGAELQHAFNSQLTRRAQRHLQSLFRMLVAPIEAHLGARDLVVAPYQALHYVPFHALHDGSAYLLERRAVSYTPSATLFATASRERAPLQRALLLGVADARAPRLRDEVQLLAPLFPHATTLVDRQATLQALRIHAPTASVLHLACHGEFRPDNPLFSALQLADGNLTVRDAYGLNLRCDLAVLSACETAVSTVTPGDELLGLARGFFAAGVASLVVSLWPVSDDATVPLMESFYHRILRGAGPAAALRGAQLDMLRRYDHPFFWAPFIVIGRP
jgi:CHAT domain-containing protein/tetratricopeptide (TPR) repeat protein